MATDSAGIWMPEIPTDRRVEQAVENPKGYFRAARRRARAEILEEIAAEQRRHTGRRKNGSRWLLRDQPGLPTP
ncbi:MAG: hypothetical protein GEV07_26825 [Streptosporangiales bacterium]|nr:hypothetical protein [Streptosporangiales bacterium]